MSYPILSNAFKQAVVGTYSNTDTVIELASISNTVGNSDFLPDPASGEYNVILYDTLFGNPADANNGGSYEIMQVTSVNYGDNEITVVRGQENSGAVTITDRPFAVLYGATAKWFTDIIEDKVERATGKTNADVLYKGDDNTIEDGDGETFGQIVSGLRNKIINGNFDIWQRGTSLGAGTGSRFLADRWFTITGGDSTIAPSQQGFTAGQSEVPNNPQFFHRVVVSSGESSDSNTRLIQRIEDVRTFSGKKGKLSFWAKADSPKDISITFLQNFGSGGSSGVDEIGVIKFSVTDQWQEFSYVIEFPSISGKTIGASSFLHLWFWMDAGSNFDSRTDSLGNQSGTFDFAQVQLIEGETELPFENRPIGLELMLCQRYYYREAPAVAAASFGIAYTESVNICNGVVDFPVTMRVPPTALETTGTASDYRIRKSGTTLSCDAVPTLTQATRYNCRVNFQSTGDLIAGDAVDTRSNTSSGFLGFSAEL
jgi:hypothetical protein